MSKVSAIVLAAGLSRRMGAQNKLLMQINGRPMIEQVLEHVAESRCEEMVVVTSEDTVAHLPKAYRIIINDQPDSGMTSSIQTGYPTLRKRCDWLYDLLRGSTFYHLPGV